MNKYHVVFHYNSSHRDQEETSDLVCEHKGPLTTEALDSFRQQFAEYVAEVADVTWEDITILNIIPLYK